MGECLRCAMTRTLVQQLRNGKTKGRTLYELTVSGSRRLGYALTLCESYYELEVCLRPNRMANSK